MKWGFEWIVDARHIGIPSMLSAKDGEAVIGLFLADVVHNIINNSMH